MNLKKSVLMSLLLVAAMVLTACSGSSASIPEEYGYDSYDEYIKLANYKGVRYEKSANQVSGEEIQQEIDGLLSESAEDSHIDHGTVKADSVINMDYVGSVDGVEFDGGAAEDVDFDIADNNYIDGFAEGIIGHSVGETFDLHVTFPEDYGSEELAGKAAVFKTTINYIIEKSVPEYTDEWVKNNTDYDSKAALEEGLKEEMLKNKEASSASDERNQVFSKIVDKTEVLSYPETEFNSRRDQLTSMYEAYAETNGIDFETYLSDEMGLTREEFDEQVDGTVKSAVKQELVIHAIARAEGIKVSDSDYDAYLKQLLEDAGYTEKSYEQEKGYTIQDYAAKNNLYTSLMYEKVMDKVMEYSVGK